MRPSIYSTEENGVFGAVAELTTVTDHTHSDVDVSVVVVTWNARRFIAECLASLEQAKSTLAIEIVVVDNASSDGTAEIVRRNFPGVRLIESGKNLGFAKGNNVGISYCRGRYICLINPDVNVPPECIPLLCRYMESDPDVGIVGPRLLEWDGKPGRSTMRFPTLWNSFCRATAVDRLFSRSRALGGFLMSDFQPDRPENVDVLNGWFWMVRREALAEVGVLDRRLFMYGDDLDWCHRFRQAGWRVVLYPGAQATHYGGGTTERAPVRFSIERERANLQYWQKFHGRTSTLAYRAICSLNHLIRIAGYLALAGLSRRKRSDAVLKRRRSAACLLWLVRLNSTESEVQDERVN
jgi:GT2 family glycosyltransferase